MTPAIWSIRTLVMLWPWWHSVSTTLPRDPGRIDQFKSLPSLRWTANMVRVWGLDLWGRWPTRQRVDDEESTRVTRGHKKGKNTHTAHSGEADDKRYLKPTTICGRSSRISIHMTRCLIARWLPEILNSSAPVSQFHARTFMSTIPSTHTPSLCHPSSTVKSRTKLRPPPRDQLIFFLTMYSLNSLVTHDASSPPSAFRTLFLINWKMMTLPSMQEMMISSLEMLCAMHTICRSWSGTGLSVKSLRFLVSRTWRTAGFCTTR
mmetsp:Transcript_303/g.820  ORF Transcript_303/g.820 Transcript_303/m.820 type:complete len:262 (+) Transcript_303:489-1274(+)